MKLITEAMNAVPAKQRLAFWNAHVLKRDALGPLRYDIRIRQLEGSFLR